MKELQLEPRKLLLMILSHRLQSFFLFLFFLISQAAIAEFIDVGILRTQKIYQIEFQPRAGKYTIYTEEGKLYDVNSSSKVILKLSGNAISVKTSDQNLGTFEKVNLIGTGWYNHFRIDIGNRIERRYDDNLKVSIQKGRLSLVNNLDLDNYVAGVVEAEVGKKPPKEYFKLQAIICRTYALSNTHKHLVEGFNLCDEVHCQAYHGKTFFSDIVDAAMQTKGAVIVDSDIQLITAAFHSNCGGETVNSEDVWSKSLYYLRKVKDTFCLNKKNSFWELEVDADQWKNYVSAKAPQIGDSAVFNYSNENRLVFYPYSHNNLSFEDLRFHFRLRSTFFNVHLDTNKVVLKGKGYGHGVGLCQIGAMEMAAQGYSYSEILHFYYSGVHIIDLSALDFFKEE